MIRQESILLAADNSGAKKIYCIRILGGTRKKYGVPGDIIVGAVRGAYPGRNVKDKEIVRAAIVRTKKEVRRADGSYVRFSDNAAVIIDKNNQPRCSRIFGPVAREVRKDFEKIASLAPEVH